VTNVDGDQVYFDLYTSTLHTPLVPGTTYYYKAWGESHGTYSTANVTFMITTLPAVAIAIPLPTPTTPTEWYQVPNYAGMSAMPFYGLVNWWADTFEIPRATLWSMAGLFICMFFGILIFGISKKLLIADISIIALMIFVANMGLTSMWFILPFGIIGFACLALGERI
jgi:hypothetical protein